ncbi:MAG: hypothetical protein NUW01_06195 [Gemmatimonadaceae bacterium]|nr:hypothetical protein [Gemmatimonadaceae bacterium]
MHQSTSFTYAPPSALLALVVGVALLAGVLGGCSPDKLVGSGQLPPDVSDPDATQTEQGALAAYNGALVTFRSGVAGPLSSYIPLSGLIGDELQTLGPSIGGWDSDLEETDRRVLPAFSDPTAEQRNSRASWLYGDLYKSLHSARATAREAVRLLRRFAPSQPPALAGHLYAVEGYADVYLGDLFCSGVPLSTVDDGGFTLRPGSTTAEAYEQAVALFDSALAAATGSAPVLNLARVGKGRALLALARYSEAAQAVAAVPDGFEHQLRFTVRVGADNQTVLDASFIRLFVGAENPFPFTISPTMSDGEGGTGLDYRSSGDPRTASANYAWGPFGTPQFLPAKYSRRGDSPITLADWREARLIEAEAALQGGDLTTWLNKLNHLRQSGIAPALPDLADPGSTDARVDLLFRERAFWLFLTGHRQGDMRRLIRQYQRDPSAVYPVGTHPRGAAYGADVSAPVPAAERQFNRHFTGCIHRDA